MTGPERGSKNIYSKVEERLISNLYLSGELYYPEDHIEAVDFIRAAQEGDEIHVFITSPGGDVDIEEMYIAAFKASQAKIITHGVGFVASAATVIFLSGDERVVEDGSSYMFHNAQMVLSGDSALIAHRSGFYQRHFKEQQTPLYEEVLTPEEMKELFERAGEVYLTAGEMKERFAKHSQEVDYAGAVKTPYPNQRGGLLKLVTPDGYEKNIPSETAEISDFKEFSYDEVAAIAEKLGIDLKEDCTWEEVVSEIVGVVKGGNFS